MRFAEISRIPHNEATFEPPFAAQRIVATRYRPNVFIITPVRDDSDAVGGDAARVDTLCHAMADHYIGAGGLQGGVSQVEETPTQRALDERDPQL